MATVPNVRFLTQDHGPEGETGPHESALTWDSDGRRCVTCGVLLADCDAPYWIGDVGEGSNACYFHTWCVPWDTFTVLRTID